MKRQDDCHVFTLSNWEDTVSSLLRWGRQWEEEVLEEKKSRTDFIIHLKEKNIVNFVLLKYG